MTLSPLVQDEKASWQDLFWAKVDKSGLGGCWVWTGSKGGIGYGQLRLNGKTRRAHRLSYEMNVGPIPTGMLVCHRCDRPACVNPAHLFLGSNRDNNDDMMRKGRHVAPIGSIQGQSKLKEADVVEIKRRLSSRETKVSIARAFGVSPSAIRNIAKGESWKHVASWPRETDTSWEGSGGSRARSVYVPSPKPDTGETT